MILYEVPNIIKIFYDKENELLVHEWLEYNPENQDYTIFNILQKIYDIFLTHPVEKVIVQAEQTKGAFSPSIQKYIRDVQFPRILSDTKLRFVATVISKDERMVIGALLWQMQFDDEAKIILHNVRSESEAREWLTTMPNHCV